MASILSIFKQVIAVVCIGLMLSINAFACVEKMSAPMIADTDMSAVSQAQWQVNANSSESHLSSSQSSKTASADKVTDKAQVKETSQQNLAAKVTVKSRHASSLPISNSLPVNRGAQFIPLGTQAYLSFIQHDLMEIRPQYLLAFEFSPPITPSFMVGYRIDANTPSWFLTTFSTSARVSGWKESNLIYRFTQQNS